MAERRYSERDLITFAASMSRLALARALGQTAYEGDRDYYQVLGYPVNVGFADYLTRYERQDIAWRIVNLPATDTWKKPPQLSEADETDTEFVQAWGLLAQRLRVWNVLTRVDAISGIGQYGVLLLGVRDGKQLDEPVEAGALKGPEDVLFLKPLSEGSVSIAKWEDDAQSERFGFPETYKVQLRGNRADKPVHWTRVLHVAEGKMDSEIYGTPRLRPVFNRLEDMIKIVGGSAEATWLNMRPGTLLSPQDDYTMPTDTTAVTSREEEIRRYAHDPLRFLLLEGVTASQIGASEVPDPRGPFEVELSLIAAASGIPQRVLIGSAQGEVSASKEDTRQWFSQVSARQTNYAEPEILRPLVDRFQWMGALPPTPQGYEVGTLDVDGVRKWPSLFELTDPEKAKVTLDKAKSADSLRDPITGETPLTTVEERELLGYPGEPERIEMAALAMNRERYRSGIKSPVRGLWNGTSTRNEFIVAMGAAIRLGLRRAWIQGAKAAGISEVELTPEELVRIDEIVFEQLLHIDDFGAFIEENDKAAGGLLRAFDPRIELWANVFTSVKNEAMQKAATNPKLKWVVNSAGPCISALKLSGKVKRASQWEKAGIRPQSQQLQCMIDAGGPNVCKCFFEVTDEPMSRGRLPRIP